MSCPGRILFRGQELQSTEIDALNKLFDPNINNNKMKANLFLLLCLAALTLTSV